MIASELSLARCRALLCFALAPLPSTNPAILRGAWCAYARSRPRRGHRRSRMIHNWGRFGGHKTTRKWVRTLITGHIFRSPARPRPPAARRPTDPHYARTQTYGARSRQLLPQRDAAAAAPSTAVPLQSNAYCIPKFRPATSRNLHS